MKILVLMFTIISCARTANPNEIFFGMYSFDDKPDVSLNLLPPMRSQHHPKVCHASWAFAITTTMSTLFNKERKGVFPEVVLSPQMLVHKRPATVDFSCNGTPGFKIEAILEHLTQKGVSDETCNNWFSDDKLRTDQMAECMDCHGFANNCEFVPYRAHKLKSYRKITSEKSNELLKNEDLRTQVLESLFSNGPLVCKMNHSSQLFDSRQSKAEIYEEKGDPTEDSSWFTLSGYSQNYLKGKPVVSLISSFGDNVGHYGAFLIEVQEKSNPLNVFSDCYELVINPDVEFIKGPRPTYKGKLMALEKGVKRIGVTNNNWFEFNQGLLLDGKVRQYQDEVDGNEPLEPIDWRNFNGRNHLTYVKNQHIPVYCGSCWAQASLSVMADQLNIDRIKKGIPYPKINLSIQAVLNCKNGGTCHGGWPHELFKIASKWRVPIESCHPYEAKDSRDSKCQTDSVCTLPLPQNRDKQFPKYVGVTVPSYISYRKVDPIKNALKQGPLACMIMVTDKFVKYKKIEGDKLNIWTKIQRPVMHNHVVSIVGWGIQDKIEYWIIRNSWGKEWGYDGFVYLQLGKDILGIEQDCVAAKVELHELE